ncbi:tetratricopeptide repeat protein [Marinobacter sp.]|uniref:tetratricopeptide repeat protein n=1 Tax=Marinobacter sp. TaxID=50741 RepID=UPI003A93A0D7
MTRLISALFTALCLASPAMAQESFRVELGRDGETIGDMRPVFLKFETRPLPAISPSEVARRYHRLFLSSDEPEVRIDALNRLSNIRDESGVDIGFSPSEERKVYREAISSYESILERGSFGGRLDELLYQMAKAHALTGHHDESIQRLKQLVGLYPDSALVSEARFRIAESAFASGRYAEAETGYQLLVESGENDELSAKARYMLGWSQFKQGAGAWDRAATTFVTALDNFLPDAEGVENVTESSVDTIDDTFRVLALMAARQRGPDTLISWLDETRVRPWTHLLFDRLADYYAVQGQTEASVAVNEAFIRYAPDHPGVAAFMLQVVDVRQRAGQPERVRGARAEFVARFGSDPGYDRLDVSEQEKWQSFSRMLADFQYNRGTNSATTGDVTTAEAAFSLAAGYYEGLARRSVRAGELLRLAGDARLQAGQFPEALANFRRAAYEVANYSEAADAGWAAVSLLREGLEGGQTSQGFAQGLEKVSAEADRFAERFSGDARSAGLMADLSARWLAAGEHRRALDYSARVIANDEASPREHYAAWQVTAKVRQQQNEYGLAERAWTKALDLAESSDIGNLPNNPVGADETASIRKQLATVVYRQGERAAANGKIEEAVRHFRRVGSVLPGSDLAIKGRYDAANTLLKALDWPRAIEDLKSFRSDFPGHELTSGISEKLVHAWISSGQPALAASELLLVAEDRLAPWQFRLRAAALFHEAGNVVERNGLYRDYLATDPAAEDGSGHLQLQTMRHRLTESGAEGDHWREALVRAELYSAWHSPETLKWSSRASLVLGARAAAAFTSIELVHPLEDSLALKRNALETARQRFLDAEALGGEAVRSESLYRRAELYRGLARDLMASSVPADLNELETMQYQMLLEEEAYPFEEKAIRLHTENHRQITSRGYDAWIGRSLDVLADLHPGRYQRKVKWLSWNMEAGDGA